MARKAKGTVSPAKAKKILADGEVQGHPLTEKQKGFFGARAGGAPEKPAGRKAKAKRKGPPHGKRFKAADFPNRDYRGETTDASGSKWRV